MSLKNIAVSNFKAFGDLQKLPIKPITLLFGTNSSGKSSLIQSILLLDEILRQKSWDIKKTTKGGDLIDLGGVRQYLHKGNWEEGITFELIFSFFYKSGFIEEHTVNIEFDDPELGNRSRSDDGNYLSDIRILVDYKPLKEKLYLNELRIYEDGCELHPNFSDTSYIPPEYYHIEKLNNDGLLLSIKRIKNDILKVDYINEETKLINKFFRYKTFDGLFDLDKAPLEEIYKDLIFTEKSFLEFQNYIFKDSEGTMYGIPFQTANKLDFLNNFIGKIIDNASTDIERLIYLGPIRIIPNRIFLDDGPNSEIKDNHSGLIAWQNLLRDKDLLSKVNHWITDSECFDTNYTIEKQTLVDIESLTDHPDLNKTIENLKNLKKYVTLVLKDKIMQYKVSLNDVGIGISQFIPIIVQSLANENRIITIEQPELHLHPAYQARLAKLFKEGVSRGNRFILETHSEHLVKAVQLEIARFYETKGKDGIKPEDVSIAYISKDPEKEQSVIKLMQLDNMGNFTEPWPDDFFDSSADITIERLRLLSKAKN